MSIRIRSKVIGVLFVFLICSTTSYAANQFKFKFNPPEVTATQTFKTTKVKDLGAGKPQVDVLSGKMKMEFKKTSAGYSVIHTPISVEMTRNGLVPNDVMGQAIKLMQNAVVVFDIDKDGHLADVRGLDQLYDQIVEIFRKADASLVDKAGQFLASIKESAKAKETVEWDAKIYAFVGIEGNIGDVWESDSVIELPVIGDYAAAMETRAAETVVCGGRKCIRLKFNYTADAKSLPKSLNKMLNDMAKSTGGNNQLPKVINAKITGQGQRVIDPSTMLIYSETINRKVEMLMDIPGRGKTNVSMKENREYTYSYP